MVATKEFQKYKVKKKKRIGIFRCIKGTKGGV